MRKTIYGIAFFFIVHNALVMYVNSSFLETFVPVRYVGFIYTVAALLSILGLSKIPNLLSRYGHYRITMALFALSAITLLGMLSGWVLLVIPLFIIHEIAFLAVRGNADVYLEEYSGNESTGSIRGTYMTVLNFAIALSPLVISFIITDGQYYRAYALALGIVILVGIYAARVIRRIPDVSYTTVPFWHSVRSNWHKKDLRNVFMTTFLLQFFFSWMVIYTPIFLHQDLGFGWGKIGIMFSIMLLPYILFELPLGRLADTKLGEKEFLVAGFIVIAIPTALMAFVSTPSFWLWTAILFATRVGASFVEIMGETYFFKKVDAENTNAIEFFRDARPLAYVFGPLLGSAALAIVDIRFLFLILAVIVLSGTYFAMGIKDTL